MSHKVRWAALGLAVVIGAGLLVWHPWTPAPDKDTESFSVGPSGATATIRGVEVVVPAGAVETDLQLTGRPAAEPDLRALAPAIRRLGGGVDLAFTNGVQPKIPVQARIPVAEAPQEGFAPVLVTVPSDGTEPHLVPATYDPAARRLVAEVDHFSGIFPALLDFAAAGKQIMTVLAPFLGGAVRSECAGKPAQIGGTTVRIEGNYGADQVPAAWPCVTAANDKLTITLASNAGIPFRIKPPAGWPDPVVASLDVDTSVVQASAQALARGVTSYRDLLMPKMSLSYQVPLAQLPAEIRAMTDPGPYLGLIVVWMARVVMKWFGLEVEQLSNLDDNLTLLRCAADAGAASDFSGRSFVEIVANVWKAIQTCLLAVMSVALAGKVGAVFTLLSGGIPLVLAGVEALLRAKPFTIPLTVDDPPWNNADLMLRSTGLGAVKVGMTNEDAMRAAGVKITGPRSPEDCRLYQSPEGSPMWRADSGGRVEMIVVDGPAANAKAGIRTPEGIRIGDPVSKVMNAYGGRAVRRVDIYGATVVTVNGDNDTALRFDSYEGTTVDSMEAGFRSAIGFVELCG
jgi:hypothetical protein